MRVPQTGGLIVTTTPRSLLHRDLIIGLAARIKASEADAVLKIATVNRPHQHQVTYDPGQKTLAAMKRSNVQNVSDLIRAIEKGATVVDQVVLDEIKVHRDQAARRASEYALLEATEQKFGAKQDYAKTIGNWARGVQNKFVDGFVLQRQERHPHKDQPN